MSGTPNANGDSANSYGTLLLSQDDSSTLKQGSKKEEGTQQAFCVMSAYLVSHWGATSVLTPFGPLSKG